MTEAFKGTNTAAYDALSLASVEIARTDFLVGRASSDKGRKTAPSSIPFSSVVGGPHRPMSTDYE